MNTWLRKLLGLCDHKYAFVRQGAFSELPMLRNIFKCQKCGKLKTRKP